MAEIWPAGSEAAHLMLDRLFHTKARISQLADASPLPAGEQMDDENNRFKGYMQARDHANVDSTSRLSPYLAGGVISGRARVRTAMKTGNIRKLDQHKISGPVTWMGEVAWRDFYIHIMAAFPRVSMGRPFYEKFDSVKRENKESYLNAWKAGRARVPIVDAAMRQCNTQGWMHSRARLIAAEYLTKYLMLDWRLGEKMSLGHLVI
ncbi:deoxyribodipyrimidine photo-lyase [Ceratobasidium sp. AG-Ba]|nr:deoxyribodipyrimidine photo-lyase [Ceratobasidium sp. AG-Ba]